MSWRGLSCMSWRGLARWLDGMNWHTLNWSAAWALPRTGLLDCCVPHAHNHHPSTTRAAAHPPTLPLWAVRSGGRAFLGHSQAGLSGPSRTLAPNA